MKYAVTKIFFENGIIVAQFDCVMNPIDFLIIYLACGAPFSVYYFLKNRAQKKPSLLWLKTFLYFLFWIPFALLLLSRNKNFKIPFFNFGETLPTDSNQGKNLCLIQKRIEKVLLESNLKTSIYELRETIGRYIGLTVANQPEAAEIGKSEAEIFCVSQRDNSKLGSICLERRNRKRLSFHHIEARKDFLYLIKQLSKFSLDDSRKKTLQHLATELVENLNDTEARIEIEKMFVDSMQTGNRPSVRKLEKDLWKPEIRKPLPAKQTSLPLPLNAAMNLHKKD